MGTRFLTQEECTRIEQVIAEAECNCSGEIHVHVDKHCSSNVLDDAAKAFARLGMHKTELRNGVLFYLASEERKFAVIGDVGINQKVDEDFWNDVCVALSDSFRAGDIVGGLCAGIRMTGEKLKAYFPYQSDDKNELPNEVSFGD